MGYSLIEMAEYKDLVYIDWNLIFTIGNTLILFFILKHFLYEKVKKVLNSREDEIQKIYDDANQANESAQSLKSNYEVQIATVKEQSAEIIKTATKKAQNRTDDMLSQAGEKASAMMLRAQSQIDIEKKKAVNEIKDEMADLAILAAEQVLKKEMNTADNEKLINDFIENAGDIKWQN